MGDHPFHHDDSSLSGTCGMYKVMAKVMKAGLLEWPNAAHMCPLLRTERPSGAFCLGHGAPGEQPTAPVPGATSNSAHL